MEQFVYPAILTPDAKEGGFVVTFVDLPEAITQGETEDEAWQEAADCLEEAIANRIVSGLSIPPPSRSKRGQYAVPVAAQNVRRCIDWKYALALPLEDQGFNASVLSEFRTRLVEGQAEQGLFDTVLTCLRERDLLKARGRQRTDSTHVLAAVRTLNRLACVAETLRHALNDLAEVAPAWLRAQITPEWFDRYSQRVEEYRLPTDKRERQRLAETIGRDGFALLTALDGPTAPAGVWARPALQVLRRVWIQQYYVPTPEGRWRTAEDLPPHALLICSPYDTEARYATKRETHWTGYKVHLTETCDAASPHLITNVETTPATTN